jgi:hypothetical protein
VNPASSAAQSCVQHESAPAALRDFNPAYVGSGSKAESLRNGRMSAFASSSGHISARAFSSFVPILLQKSFCTRDQNFFWLSREFRVKMWGTSSPEDKTRWRPR